MKIYKSFRGQSLVEVLIALAIACLVALGLVRLSTISIRSTRYSSDQSKATAFAQKKIGEIIEDKGQYPTQFWDGTYTPTDEYDSVEDSCVKGSLSDISLPTTTPNYSIAKMKQITVSVYWENTGAGDQCGGKNFNHSLTFTTYVTN